MLSGLVGLVYWRSAGCAWAHAERHADTKVSYENNGRGNCEISNVHMLPMLRAMAALALVCLAACDVDTGTELVNGDAARLDDGSAMLEIASYKVMLCDERSHRYSAWPGIHCVLLQVIRAIQE